MSCPPNDEFETFFAVWTKPRDDDPGTLKPVRSTRNTLKAARRVAMQMSQENPGRKWFIFQAVERIVTHVEGLTPEVETPQEKA